MKIPDCKCFSEMAQKLELGHSLKFHEGSSNLVMVDLTPYTSYGLPLQTVEGRKPKPKQPNIVYFGFCPWCGKAYQEVPKSDGTQPVPTNGKEGN